MQHIRDFNFRGHEIMLYKDGNTFAVDVRIDDFDGEIIAGYNEFNTLEEAIYNAMAYVDGYEKHKNMLKAIEDIKLLENIPY